MTADPGGVHPGVVQASRPGELSVATLYALLRLRIDVFVVEQSCPYPELDGRDLEPATWHLWTADEHGPTAYLRLLGDGANTARIGRVCTRVDVRGSGLAARLMTEAVDRAVDRAVGLGAGPDARIVLDAQTYLTGWYTRFGFIASGPEFVEDGIAHTPMRRPAAAGA